jgi:hypothetical protein
MPDLTHKRMRYFRFNLLTIPSQIGVKFLGGWSFPKGRRDDEHIIRVGFRRQTIHTKAVCLRSLPNLPEELQR